MGGTAQRGHTKLPAAKRRKTKTIGLEVHGIAAPVEVRRHAGARRLTLRVSKTRRAVVVTVPVQCRMDEAGRFLKSHIEWVRDRLGRVPEPVPFVDGAQIPAARQAASHPLHRQRTRQGRRRYRRIRLRASPASTYRGRVEHAARRLKDWLAQQARADLDERVSRHARKLGVRPRRIGLRDQTSRWGSCSSNGLLSFSWRLILAPPLVLDYVAAHEVAHLVEMNHGARFWKLVAECVPRLDEAKHWLRHEGSDLHRYGVEWTAADRDL